jgi:hypothetical protein
VAVYRVLIELLGATSEPVVVVGGGVDIMPDQLKFASYTPEGYDSRLFSGLSACVSVTMRSAYLIFTSKTSRVLRGVARILSIYGSLTAREKFRHGQAH